MERGAYHHAETGAFKLKETVTKGELFLLATKVNDQVRLRVRLPSPQ